jgi:RNA polymerase sigma-70 factor (ECF subfamily)
MSADVAQLETYRTELRGHCYRMLASPTDAEDAVQDTMVRAWQALDRFEGRASVRTWLYRIATNVCLDALTSRTRRTRPVEDGPMGTVHDELRERPDGHWLEPIPDALAIPASASPFEQTALRQSIRLAFVAALQHLPARQRAALLLTDVLGWSAAEVAECLETTVAAVNSALQRARATLASQRATGGGEPLTGEQAQLLDRFVDAFHRYDIDALVTLLRNDAVLSMPPYTLWLQGRQAIADWMLGRGIGCRGSQLLPVDASGMRAYAQYTPAENGGHEAWALIVPDVAGVDITATTFFLDTEKLFPLFGLPLTLGDR